MSAIYKFVVGVDKNPSKKTIKAVDFIGNIPAKSQTISKIKPIGMLTDSLVFGEEFKKRMETIESNLKDQNLLNTSYSNSEEYYTGLSYEISKIPQNEQPIIPDVVPTFDSTTVTFDSENITYDNSY